jgi:hypothetical protein
VFENRVLRRIFGPMRDEVMGGWRQLHKEDPHDLYSLPGIIRIIECERRRNCDGNINFSFLSDEFQFCNSPYHDVGVQPVFGELSVAQLHDVKVLTCSHDVYCDNDK